MPVPTFNTLEREASFRNPVKEGSSVPILAELAAPHVESFNALFADSGLPIPHGHEERNVGLLGLAIKDIEDKVMFDGPDGTHEHGAGNKLRSRFPCALYASALIIVLRG
jgi:DNA-directed RNA polymerase I subunit RPA2